MPDIWSDPFWVSNVLLLSKTLFTNPLPSWVLGSIHWISFLDSSPWLWEDTLIAGSKSMDCLVDSFVSNIFALMVVMMMMLRQCCCWCCCRCCCWINPLPRSVSGSICWVCLINSSPWLWKDALIIGSKSVNSLIDSLVSNIVALVMVVMMMSLLRMCLWFLLGIECSSTSTKANWLWEGWIFCI